MEKWNRSVAVITGANSGNGFAILRKLAESGLNVVGFDVETQKIDSFKAESKSLKVYSVVCDVTDDDEAEIAFQWVDDTLGGVDILINNAGTLRDNGVFDHEKPMTEISKVINLNFTAVVRCARLAFRSMIARENYGYIININSIYGHFSPPEIEGINVGVYPGTKYAITATTEVMRQELLRMGNRKIRVTSISPGVVDTNIFRAAGISQEDKKILLETPHLSPEDIGETVAYLLAVPYTVSVHEITVRATGSVL